MLYNVHAKNKRAINKQTPSPPNNEINKPTVGGISDGKEINMSYKVTITNNKTGEIIVDNGNVVAIVGTIADEEKVGQMWFTSCDPLTLAIVIQEAEGVISKIKRELPEVDASLQLMEIMEKDE